MMPSKWIDFDSNSQRLTSMQLATCSRGGILAPDSRGCMDADHALAKNLIAKSNALIQAGLAQMTRAGVEVTAG